MRERVHAAILEEAEIVGAHGSPLVVENEVADEVLADHRQPLHRAEITRCPDGGEAEPVANLHCMPAVNHDAGLLRVVQVQLDISSRMLCVVQASVVDQVK